MGILQYMSSMLHMFIQFGIRHRELLIVIIYRWITGGNSAMWIAAGIER